jgi:3-oxoacyl-[acyl-carrier protein] reductase
MTDRQPLAGRTALVTGAGAGMGRAHCEALAARGAHVVALDLRAEKAGETVAAIEAAGHAGEPLAADVSDLDGLRPRLAAVVTARGAVDILVNNAGISGLQTPFEEIDEDFYDRMMAVHVKGAFFATQMLVPAMKARKYGKIVNVSSVFAMKGSPNAPHYTAAKGALLGLTKALAVELAPWNICVNAIAPPLIRTEMTLESLGADSPEWNKRAAAVPLGGRLAEPAEMARTVAFLAGPDSDFITGQTLSPNGGEAIVGI